MEEYIIQMKSGIQCLQSGKPILNNPKLIHYNLFSKPWCYDNIQYEEYFWKYAEISGFYKDIMDFKNDFTDDKKEYERKCLENLIANAVNIIDKDVTFKKMYDAKKDIRL